MTINVKAFANADDVLIAWMPDPWPAAWVGFQLERRNEISRAITIVANRIPPQPGAGPVGLSGVPSTLSPIRRCLWTDHEAVATGRVSYRVTALRGPANGPFTLDAASASAWTSPVVFSGDAGGGLSAYFNRGTLMSQIVSRFVQGNVTEASLQQFLTELATPGFAARLYLAGDALPQMLSFLHDADRRGSAVHAAIYEINDHELVDALKPFGARGHILIGNGGATQPWVAQELGAAGLEVRHRDLSNGHGSSPSVHNKFVVESAPGGENSTRVLTGSTNWTTSGLCTQLNNVLIIEDSVIAARYVKQWQTLVADGNQMPAALKSANSIPTSHASIELFFAATNHEVEFKPILDAIAAAQEGVLFLMFMPGQSPLLSALLDRAQQNAIYVRGVVSSVTSSPNGQIGTVGGQVVKSGAPAQAFHKDVLLPVGISEQDKPAWEEAEFNVSEMLAAHLIAIVHSKAIVVDPFSENCVVITGSHNFSVSASQKNDENLVIIRGNRALAQAYAVHINAVYDHYSWRAYLASGGDPNQVYKPLDDWKPGGSRAQELDFWMQEFPQPKRIPKTRTAPRSAPAKRTTSRSRRVQQPKTQAARKTVRTKTPQRRPAKPK